MNNCIEKNSCYDVQEDSRFIGADFDVCLPFGSRLYSIEGVVTYEEGSKPADGIYTSITVRNGCIVAVGNTDISTYTSSPCAPVPAGCGEGGTVSMLVSSSSGNLSRLDSSGKLLTTLNVFAGEGISIEGVGTTTNPLVISATGTVDVSFFIHSGNDAIIVDGSGSSTDPFVISHKENLDALITANGFVFDRYGHLVSYDEPSSYNTLNGIITGPGLTSETDVNTGIATIDLAQPLHKAEGTYDFGGYIVTVDEYNRIYEILDNTSAYADAITNAVVHKVTEGRTFSFSFTTKKESKFKISVEYSWHPVSDTGSDYPVSPTMSIDGTDISFYLLSSGFISVPSTKFSAGQHIVSGTIAESMVAFITIMLVDVV